jgi:NTP pyrophosphatase (non-canonical NTP hydrolase)
LITVEWPIELHYGGQSCCPQISGTACGLQDGRQEEKCGMLTIEAYQKKIDAWVNTVGVRYFSELTNTAILMEEVGEVARIMARTYGDQSFKNPEENHDLADELADVLFVVGCLANQTGIDLTAAVERNLAKKTRRDFDRHRRNPKLKSPAAPGDPGR